MDILVIQIRQLLTEIVTDCFGARVSGDNGNIERIQRENFRKLAWIDWMILIESERVMEKQQGAILRKLFTLKGESAVVRRIVAATQEDFKRMSIPLPMPKKAGSFLEGRTESCGVAHSFPGYLDLPQIVVREKIVDYVTSVKDKLNLVKAVPVESDLKKYLNLPHLYFHLVFPILMKQHVLDWKEIYNLTQIDPYFHEMIHFHLKNVVLLDFFYVENHKYWHWGVPIGHRKLEHIISTTTPTRSGADDSIPIKIRLELKSNQAREENEMGILRQCGHRIQDCYVHLKWIQNVSPPELLLWIIERLRLIPNVINLTFVDNIKEPQEWDDDDGGWDVPQHWEMIKDIPMPELLSLKSINLELGCYNWAKFEPVKMKLATAYRNHVQNLVIFPCFARPDFNPDPVPFPALVNLKLELCAKVADDIQDYRLFLSVFGMNKLKVLKLDMTNLGWEGGSAAMFCRLLRHVSTHFGSTLEELSAIFNDNCPQYENKDIAQQSSTWMVNCQFPKLRKLSMTYFPRPDDTAMLLLFPAVEELEFEVADETEAVDSYGEQELIVELWYNLEEMQGSNIWKLLPNLQTFKLVENQNRVNTLTRAEVVIWNNRMIVKEFKCTICLESLHPVGTRNNNENLACSKAPCGHYLHDQCVGNWLERSLCSLVVLSEENGPCDVCRQAVMESKLVPVELPFPSRGSIQKKEKRSVDNELAEEDNQSKEGELCQMEMVKDAENAFLRNKRMASFNLTKDFKNILAFFCGMIIGICVIVTSG